jgi:transposase-like protein
VIPRCPQNDCLSDPPGSDSIRFGFYYRSSDSRWIQRFRCRTCGKTYSQASTSPCFGQKKRQINSMLGSLLFSAVSMRRAGRVLRIHRTTVARKLRFLAQQARLALDGERGRWKRLPGFEFDELETFESSKCKPLSVALAVVPGTRKILGFEVASMPCKGPLAQRARRRYGNRLDQRGKALDSLFRGIQPHICGVPIIRSDQNPRYPRYVKRYFPQARHQTFQGRRGCVTGQGELKRGRWDPLFSLNHTFAMLRANLSRLVRKTWCTTKKAQSLADHLAIYARYHNGVLTA